MSADAADGFGRQDLDDRRRRMVERIEDLLARCAGETGGLMLSAPVRQALLTVPRHAFVPPGEQHEAYANRPLDIGEGQTISQPFIVALMTELLQLEPRHRVLEIGTGCGYQTAILAQLAGAVWTIEIVAELGRKAAVTLAHLGFANVHARIGDGYAGWPEAAPFDRIIVTAAPDHVPPALVAQLAASGRMVIPVGRGEGQDLILIRKDADGRSTSQTVIPVRFVPLTRE